jgi:hypothetical protein
MNPKELAQHKAVSKELQCAPTFKPMKRGKLPKPLHKMGGARLMATDLLPISNKHRAIFLWRNGETLQDTLFMAWMFCVLENEDLYPIFEMHFHPSHKGVHCKTPCNTSVDYTNRQLPSAPELRLQTDVSLDPRQEISRHKLILQFCKSCGIQVCNGEDSWNLSLI